MRSLTRRAFSASAAALVASPAFARSPAHRRPLVIAHRGASGERPEHTDLAYRLAIAQGADFIEPDLVLTRDRVLVARHENEISGTTDVAERADFASRRTSKTIDGKRVEGWFTEDFTLAELKTLRARERLPKLRPDSAAFDGEAAILTFSEVVELAREATASTGRTIGVYPEMKHPTYFASIGLRMVEALAGAVRDLDLDHRDAPLFVQCFEPRPLKAFRELSRAPTVMLVGAGDLPQSQLSELSEFSDGLGPELALVLDLSNRALPPRPLMAQAKSAGLQVHPWTVRRENSFLPASLRRGSDPAGHGEARALLRAVFAAGADGVFTDFPGLAHEVRDELFFRLRSPQAAAPNCSAASRA